MLKQKKAVLGLDTIRAVFLAFLILAVIGITTILTLSSIRDASDKIDTTTLDFDNVSTAGPVNESGIFLTGINPANLRNCGLTITQVMNDTDAVIIQTGNYTVSGCIINGSNALDSNLGNVTWAVNGSYTYSEQRATSILGNVSDATASFFGNTTTIFAILIVIVIILAITIILVAISRFSGAGSSI